MVNYSNPVLVEYGLGSIDFLGRFLQGRKVLLITSPTFEKNGLVISLTEKYKESISLIISTVTPNPTLDDIVKIRSNLDYTLFDGIIALGGGSVIDTAKALSVYDLSLNESIDKVIREGFASNSAHKVKPIIAIPTTAGTGSEVTMWGTIWDDKQKLKYSISHPSLYCETAILDANLHITLSKELTIHTGLDALSHSLEAIWNKNANPISDKYAISAIQDIIETLPLLAEDLTNIYLREKMLLASFRAGLAFSNTQTSIAHAMSYYMTLYKGVPHGIAASFTLPTIMEVAMQNNLLAAKLETAFGEKPIETLIKFFDKLKVSIQPTDYSLNNKDWENILKSLNGNIRARNSILDETKIVSLLMDK